MNGRARPSPVDSAVAIHVYRVLQEALNNVARHSGSQQAWVRLRFEPDVLAARSRGSRQRARRAPRAAGSASSPCASARSWSAARSSSAVPARAARWFAPRADAERRPRCRLPRSLMADKITVLLADDHSLVRRGFRRMLEDDPTIDVVGEASNGDEAIAPRAPRSSRPWSSWTARCPARAASWRRGRFSTRDSTAAVLMLSMHAEETLVRQALDAGARGYILKNALDLDLAAAVRQVAAGETVLDPTVSRPRPVRSRASGTTV